MSIESLFPSTEAIEQILALGAEEGLKQAVGQIDAILAEDGVSSTRRSGRPSAAGCTKNPGTWRQVKDDHEDYADNNPDPGRPRRRSDI
jgi:hypothetical protein